MGKQCIFKTHNGSISTGDVGEQSTLKTHNGDINCNQVNIHASLTTHNGDIRAGVMCDHSSATSHNGDVRADKVAKTVQLETCEGNVYENGVKRKKDPSQYSTVSYSSVTVSGGGIFIGGQDLNAILRAAAESQAFSTSGKQDDSQPPVRYTRR